MPVHHAHRWWVKGDNPWQLLATCMELRNAWACGNEEEYQCAWPVHVDGSCNGLQHYAALGRDLSGGAAVNLMPAPKPQVRLWTVCDSIWKECNACRVAVRQSLIRGVLASTGMRGLTTRVRLLPDLCVV